MRCAICGTDQRLLVFPASVRQEAGTGLGEATAAADESSCFFHPSKRASVACARCGRFLCPLCDLDVDGAHVCPRCLEAGLRKKTFGTYESERTCYDRMALAVAVFPMFLHVFTVFTAPVAIFLAIRHWNAPRGIEARSRFRLVLAILLAVLEIVGVTLLFIGIVTNFGRR